MFKFGEREEIIKKKEAKVMKKNEEKSLKKDRILSLEKREKRRVVIKTAAGVLASAIIAGGGALSLFLSCREPNSTKFDDETSYVKIDEIWNANNSTFNKTNLQKLLDSFCSRVVESGQAKYNIPQTVQTATDLKAANNGKDIEVTIGGLDWEVVYLSQDKSGNPILTLWLDNNKQDGWDSRSADEGAGYGFYEGGLYSVFSMWSTYEMPTDGTAAYYPSNMYGTSYIRAVTLNNGGYYSTGTTKLTDKEYAKNSSSVFAKFTMNTVAGNLTKYIVKPEQVEWQENQSAKEQNIINTGIYAGGRVVKYSYNNSNDAWSKSISNGFYRAAYNYAEHDHSDEWKNDYLWLPSQTETDSSGLWKTSQEQRQNYDGKTQYAGSVGGGTDKGMNETFSSQQAETYSFLRSTEPGLGDIYDPAYDGLVRNIHNSGDGMGGTSGPYMGRVTDSGAVRSAFHLNLNEVIKSAGIKTVSSEDFASASEIWRDGFFDKQNFQNLLDNVSGESNTTMDRIKELAEEIKIPKKAPVSIGGLSWTPVYLSQDKDNNPILTLWFSENQPQWKNSNLSSSQGQFYGFVDGGLYSDFSANWSAYGSSSTDSVDYYPSNMYGTSYVRAVTLNNGGQYSLNNNELSKRYEPDKNSVFAKFTMPSETGNLTDFIVKPEQVEWQENQSATNYGYPSNYSNEAWNKEIADTNFYGKNFAHFNLSDAWKNDYIWLPSIAELGWETDYPILSNDYSSNTRAEGLWKLSSAQKSIKSREPGQVGGGTDQGGSGGGAVGTAHTEYWLRTAYSVEMYVYIPYAETNLYLQFVDSSNAVRPAFHLNLQKASENIKDESDYTWQDLTAAKFDNETSGHLQDDTIGTEETPYEIRTAEQLALLAKDVNNVNNGNSFSGKYFIQTADIRLDGYEWTPIGTSGYQFSGNYNGNGFAIDGLTINNTDEEQCYLGLFGDISGSKIENVTLASGSMTTVDIISNDKASCIGMIGWANTSRIINCKNYANIDGHVEYVGGIVGYCYDANWWVFQDTITNCTNYGTIKGINETLVTGGIAGFFVGQISGCYNYGDVSVGQSVGGLIGDLSLGVVKNCISNATVSGEGDLGSLFGEIYSGGAENCAAFGRLEGATGVLVGKVGSSQQIELKGCSFEGFVVGENNFDKYVGTAGEPLTDKTTITCCYVCINQEGYFTKASDNWSEYFTILDMPKQKSLYWPAAAVDQTNEEIIAEMKAMGFTEYVQT